MLSLEDKMNILKWSFIIFSVVVMIAVAVSCCRNKGLPLLLYGATIVIILGTLAIVDMYWIEVV
jgi:hypothetical protein